MTKSLFISILCVVAGSAIHTAVVASTQSSTSIDSTSIDSTSSPTHNIKVINPLEKPKRWQSLTYRNIAANKVSFINKTAVIEVQNSASPLIYPLDRPLNIKSVEFKIQITGNINLKGKKQGSKGADDAVFRLGLVYEGNKTLGWLERQLAAKWIKTLYKLAPKDSGIDYVEFYNVYSDPSIAGLKRKHPLSPLLTENYLYNYANLDKQEALSINREDSNGTSVSAISGMIKPDNDKAVLALWISSDGDDTNSHYQVEIETLTIAASQ